MEVEISPFLVVRHIPCRACPGGVSQQCQPNQTHSCPLLRERGSPGCWAGVPRPRAPTSHEPKGDITPFFFFFFFFCSSVAGATTTTPGQVRLIDPRSHCPCPLSTAHCPLPAVPSFAPGLRKSPFSPVFSFWRNPPPLTSSQLKKNRPRVELRAQLLFFLLFLFFGVRLSISFGSDREPFHSDKAELTFAGECDLENCAR